MAIKLQTLGDPTPLFYGQSLSDHTTAHTREALQAVDKIAADVLLNTPTDDIIAELAAKHTFHVPELKLDDAYMEEPIETLMQVRDYGRDIPVKGSMIALVIPFSGDGGLFYARPNSFLSSPPYGNLYHSNLILTHKAQSLDAAAINKSMKARLNEINQYLGWQKELERQHNQTMPGALRPTIENRKTRLLSDRNISAGLDFPVRKRGDAPSTYVAPVQRKKIDVFEERPTAKHSFTPEPVLSEAAYNQILDTLQSMALVMERNPSTFAKMDEEALRDTFLVALNSQFEGGATGETFNAAGKTDILIRVKDRNVFIAECKIWRGPKQAREAISQLLSYLTWRDTKTALMIFNRNKDFSSVIAGTHSAFDAHPQKKHGPTVQGETRFSYVFTNPTDANRQLTISALLFDVPS